MLTSWRNPSQNKNQQQKNGKEAWLSVSVKPQNMIPGLIIGFLLGFLIDLTSPEKPTTRIKSLSSLKRPLIPSSSDEELKMVLVVRQDLKMGAGKIASQCAHAATGMYSQLMQRAPFIHIEKKPALLNSNFPKMLFSQRSLLRQWEQCGQPKIVVTCKNQQEMNKLKGAADGIGLPTFVVADAGRTQVMAGSKTVLAIGPGTKASVDSVTGKLRLL